MYSYQTACYVCASQFGPHTSSYFNFATITRALVCNKVLFNSSKSTIVNLLHKNSAIGYIYRNSISATLDLNKVQPFNNLVFGTDLFKEPSGPVLYTLELALKNLTLLLTL